MPSLQRFAAACAVLLALSANAGLIFHRAGRVGERVWIDGDRQRVELDPDPSNPRAYDVVIHAGGQTTYINLQNKTFYRKEPRKPSLAFALPLENPKVIGKPEVTFRTEPGPQIVGRDTTKHVIEVSYRVGGTWSGEALRTRFKTVTTLYVAPSLPRDRHLELLGTAIPEIDEAVAKKYASLEGMILGTEALSAHQYEGGPLISSTNTMTVDELKEGPVSDDLFAIPNGFTYQEPVYGIPGAN